MIELNEMPGVPDKTKIRAWCIERALLVAGEQSAAEVIGIGKMLENYITTGDLEEEVLFAAYNEGASESRFEVKNAVEEWLSNVDLDDLFLTKGWMLRLPNQAPEVTSFERE
jgi:hypothetical protein